MRKRIALISQSSHHGGAETAFMNMLRVATSIGYQVSALFPNAKGPLFREAAKLGADTLTCEISRMLGDPVATCNKLSGGSYKKMRELLSAHSIDLVISNSLSVFDGALAAAELNLPHIWSVHEIVEKSPEFTNGATALGTFGTWVSKLSDHVIYCSKSARDASIEFLNHNIESTILAPYLAETIDQKKRPSIRKMNSKLNLFFIGAPTERKNHLFATEVLKALVMRGNNAHIYFIGDARDHTGLLDNLVRRRGMSNRVTRLGYVADPYKYFTGRSVNLIYASKPFSV